jgi:Spy/CpxP family protein refolding chaperone
VFLPCRFKHKIIMKKLLVLVAVFTTVLLSNANAQGGNFDTAAMKARYLERTKPALIEKTKLTDAQADKVLEINWQSRSKMRGMRDLSQDERQKMMDNLQTERNKQYKDIPLTDDQIKAVNDFFEEQRKQMQQQRQQNGGGGNRN